MVENHPDTRKQEYRGIACLVLSAFCFALMSMFVHLAGDLPSMQKSFFRNEAENGCYFLQIFLPQQQQSFIFISIINRLLQNSSQKCKKQD